MNNKILELIKQKELQLLDPETRSNDKLISELIHDEFKEISKSGNVYNKKNILDHLPKENKELTFMTKEWEIVFLNDQTVRVNFISSESKDNFQKEAFRTSIWIKTQTDWKMIFHQGTPKK